MLSASGPIRYKAARDLTLARERICNFKKYMAKPDNTAGADTNPAPRANAKPEARLPKGMRDIGAAELRQQREMIEKVRAVYERYGFEPLETPAFEYTEALGKFLPDQDRPNEGVFSFQDEDEQWLSLRYDLTAPLARYVAENFQSLPKPFRRYAVGPVWRNEKPGPGRFRQFMQFDADTVGAESVAADAEMCMLAADTMEALGFARGDYVIKVNNRKVLEGFLENSGLAGDHSRARRLIVLRAIDKADRIGIEGVEALLGQERRDASGAVTEGAKLSNFQIERIMSLFRGGPPDGDQSIELGTIGGAGTFGIQHAEDAGASRDMMRMGVSAFLSNIRTLESWLPIVGASEIGKAGIQELRDLVAIVEASGYGSARIRVDSSVVRGLEYYTGPVFEAEITKEAYYAGGEPVRFGSVGGGGRYDDLVARFTGERVPATGFSIGVSRLQAALAALNKNASTQATGPVVVLVMEKDRVADYQKLVQALRNADIRAELYLGSSGMKAQMKYADRRASPCVVIQGGDERAKGEVTLKDLVEGAKAAAAIKDNKEWKEARPAQVAVKEADLVAEVRKILARHGA
jgi:histidyl-tRNA synthetase